MRSAAAVGAAFAALCLVACGGTAKTEPTGSIALAISGPGSTASVAGQIRQAIVTGERDAKSKIKSVWVSFESAEVGYFGDFQRVQLVDGGQFPITDIRRTTLAAGTYTVSAYAYDGAEGGTVLFSATAQVKVTDRQVSTLNLIMQQAVAPGSVDVTAPVISAIAITGTYPPAGGKSVGLAATVQAGSSATYSWKVSCAGDFTNSSLPFSAPTALATSLTLNNCASDATVTFSVTDASIAGAGGSITSTVSFVLPYVPQGVTIGSISINPWPNITSLRATTDAQPLPGQTVTFVADASDPDGGDVSYAWSAKCGGVDQNAFAPGNAASVVWTAPSRAANCTIKVTVDDGEGGTNSATISLSVVDPIYTTAPWIYPDNSAVGSTVSWLGGVLALTKTDPATASGITIASEPQPLSTLAFDVSGYCGAGAPRFNAYFAGGVTCFFGCAYGTHSGSTVTFTSADALCGAVPMPTTAPIGIEIVMDEVGTTSLTNIKVNGSLVQ